MVVDCERYFLKRLANLLSSETNCINKFFNKNSHFLSLSRNKFSKILAASSDNV